jgi:gas vesicle protein
MIVKNALLSLANFAGGALLGAAGGAVVAALTAPKSGPELQRQIKERVDEAQQARVTAERETEERLWQKFRQDVSRSSGDQPTSQD